MFFTQIGYYFLYSYQLHATRKAIKKEILSGIPDSMLEIVVEGEVNGFRWKDTGEEFYLHNEMYDIVRTEQRNGKTIYHCINDKKEKQLLQKMTNLVKSSQHGRKQSKYLIKFQIPVYILSKSADELVVSTDQSPLLGMWQKHFSSAYAEVNDPPPWSC